MHLRTLWDACARCDDCRCTDRIDPPTINHVFEPHTGSTQYWGQSSTISYEASNGVAYVNVYLFKLHPTLTYHIQYVDTIGTFVRNTGALTWVVGRYEERDDYVVVVFHARTSASQPLAPTHRNTGVFSIRNPSTECPPGKYNSSTGTGVCCHCVCACGGRRVWACQRTAMDCMRAACIVRVRLCLVPSPWLFAPMAMRGAFDVLQRR